MILLELKRYIKRHHQVSENDLCNRFDLSLDALSGLLKPLIRQGHVQALPAGGSCSSGKCGGCQATNQTLYQWLEKRNRPLSFAIEIH